MKLTISPTKKDTKLPGILEAALRLFVARGIDGTSIRDIATEAGVAEGALYRHFKSKEELAWHLFADNLRPFTEELMAKVLAAKEARKRIHILVEECFSACEKNRALFNFLILSEHRELTQYTKDYLHPGKLIEQIIKGGQADGELRGEDSWILFSTIFGTIHRMCILRVWGLERKPLTDLSPRVTEAIWRAVKR